jgi:hypothetical protein
MLCLVNQNYCERRLSAIGYRLSAIGYLMVVCAVALWALYVDVTLRSSEHEHLLPDFVLSVIGLPTSLLFYSLGRPSWHALVQTAL